MKKTLAWLLLLTGVALTAGQEVIKLPEPEPQPGQKSVLDLRCAPIKNVRIAFVGAGNRGFGAIRRIAHFPKNATIVAVSDLYQNKIDRVRNFLKNAEYSEKVTYSTDPDAWKSFCERPDVDLIYCTTPINFHAPIAIYAMKHGKHVVVEVPIAVTIKEMWDIVDTAEQTQRHCMMLENALYRDYSLAVKKMIDAGLFGEPVYAEGAYWHDLRKMKFDDSPGNWRVSKGSTKKHYTANGYPTHGLSAPAFWMNINRGDRMRIVNSVSTGSFSSRDYVSRTFGKDDPKTKLYYQSDVNVSLIRTAMDKMIVIYHSTTTPVPHESNLKLIGTRGSTRYFPKFLFSFDPNAEKLMSDADVKKLIAKYHHPAFRQCADFATVLGGHGGVDTTMLLRLIYCLNNGLPLDMNVYDGASWSALGAISSESVKNNGAAVEMPDFTRGKWKTATKTSFHMADPKDEVKLEFAGSLKPTPPGAVAVNSLKLTDPEGDWSKNSSADFTSADISVNDKNELVIEFTSAKPIEPKRARWNLKALISIGTKGGYDGHGALYKAEGGVLGKYDAKVPAQWKWKKIGKYRQTINGGKCTMVIPLSLFENLPNRIGVRLRNSNPNDDMLPDKDKLPATICFGNVALDKRTKVEVSTAPSKGYDKAALNDGQVDARLPWNIAAWASKEKKDKVVTFTLPEARKLRRAIVYWEGGVPKKLTVEATDGGEWKQVAAIEPESDVSVIDLAKAGKVAKIRFIQKAGDGRKANPDSMWVREIELYQ